MMYLMLVFDVVGTAILVVSLVLRVLGVLSFRAGHGWQVVGFAVGLVPEIYCHETVISWIMSAIMAGNVWFWWKGGGGDDTKRRLRDTLKKFQPVRRTAPVTS